MKAAEKEMQAIPPGMRVLGEQERLETLGEGKGVVPDGTGAGAGPGPWVPRYGRPWQLAASRRPLGAGQGAGRVAAAQDALRRGDAHPDQAKAVAGGAAEGDRRGRAHVQPPARPRAGHGLMCVFRQRHLAFDLPALRLPPPRAGRQFLLQSH